MTTSRSAVAYTPPVIQMRDVVKSFGPVEVLKSVNFELEAGEVHALAGENGAGKSTLMKILQGVYPITSGEIVVDGKPVVINSTADAEAAGIGMVFQEFSLVPSLTVAQNVFLNNEPVGRGGFINDRVAEKKAQQIFDELGVDINPKASLESLGTAYWQLVEIAKALSKDARVLIMDEPTASLAKHEVENLFRLIRRLRDQGISIVYISHRMDEIRRVSDRITVLRDGNVVMTEPIADVTSAEIVEAIIGKQLARDLVYQPREPQPDAPMLLEAEGITDGNVLTGVTISVQGGSVLGLAGLMGSGRTEFARIIAGQAPFRGGTLTVCGEEIKGRRVAHATSRGVALIPEDRRAQGLVLEHSVADNLVLPSLDALSSGPFVTPRAVRAASKELVKEYDVKVANIDEPISLLSGGNQQKVVVAKWMNTHPRLLVMDEPTAGVDIGTKTEIIEMVRNFANRGGAVIYISSDLPELQAIADRIAIFRDGAVSQIVEHDEVESEQQLQLMIQGEPA